MIVIPLGIKTKPLLEFNLIVNKAQTKTFRDSPETTSIPFRYDRLLTTATAANSKKMAPQH